MITRRMYMKTLGAAALTANLFTGRVRGANDRIALGIIGAGGKQASETHLPGFIGCPGAEVVALCDVFEPGLTRAYAIARKHGADPARYHHFRDLLANHSIDAVIIATPDHWHACMSVEACKAGKDVYVEKPVATGVDEGRAMIEAARTYARVVAAGTQRASATTSRHAIEVVHSGILGRITAVDMWARRTDLFPYMGFSEQMPIPKGLDWDLWLGPLPWERFRKNRFGIPLTIQGDIVLDAQGNISRWPTWRLYWPEGGILPDWGSHDNNVLHMIMRSQTPASATALGFRYHNDERETPDTIAATWLFASPQFICRSQHLAGSWPEELSKRWGDWGPEHCMKFMGEHGTLWLNNLGYVVKPNLHKTLEQPKTKYGELLPLEEDADLNGATEQAHRMNFLDCIRTRSRPVADIEDGYRAALMDLLALASYRSGLRVDWDASTETALQPAARQFLERLPSWRNPWKLEV